MPVVTAPAAPGWLDRALWGPETGRRLYVVHVGLSVLIGLRVALGPYRQLAGTPDPLVDPVAVLVWLPGMPSAAVIGAIQVIGTAAAIAAALRWRTRWTFAVAWVAYLVLAGLRGSRGKVLHNDLLLLWAAAPFLLAPLEAAWRDRRESRRWGWPIRVATAIVVLIYFFAGYQKLRRSGPEWAFGDNMHFVALWGPSVGQPGWPGFAGWVADRPWAAKTAGIGILGLELVIPFGLVWRRLLPWFAVWAALIHAGTWLLLGLDYWAWMLAVPLLLIDWPALLDARRRRNGGGNGDPPVGSHATTGGEGGSPGRRDRPG